MENISFPKISIIIPVLLLLVVTLSLLFQSNIIIAQENNKMRDNDFTLSVNNILINNTNSPLLGSPDAPITIIDFGDFQCSMCARYVKTTEPIINETYVQTGKAKLVFKHFPIRGFDSVGSFNGSTVYK